MTEQYRPNIGQAPDEHAFRDAVHMAVAPVVAVHLLRPGESVDLNAEGDAFYVQAGEGIGIVDPFLLRSVPKGSRFWVFIYPNTITGLRHVWSHPEFTALSARKAAAQLELVREEK